MSTIALIGRESVGKSQLVSNLTSKSAGESNFRGSTVTVDRYRWNNLELVDTPGIHRLSDNETTRMALQVLNEHDQVMLVVQGTCLDQDLDELLPLVAGKFGCVVVTYWDKVQPGEAAIEAIERLSKAVGVPFVTVDARRIDESESTSILKGFAENRSRFRDKSVTVRAGWRIEPKPGIFEYRLWGPILAIAMLLLPALATIFIANEVANVLHPIVANWIDPLLVWVDAHLPQLLAGLLNAKIDDFGYGLLNMGPFLFVWALPTVVLFSLILSVYKTTGLIERMNAALNPWSRYVGLSGRDLVRVAIGFGCNVPAVISTRACSSCSRNNAVSAIAFGSACSYQLPATLAVLAAGSRQHGLNPWLLPLAFLAYLLVTTGIYLRLTSTASSRSLLNVLMHPQRPFLQWPSVKALTREAWSSVKQFLCTAIPIFVVICIVASTLAQLGWLQHISNAFKPMMMLFNLPAEAGFAVVMASIRKDGIFLIAGDDGLSMPLDPAQTLTAVYLAGVLLPCIVTALTIARESSWLNAGKILARQAFFAIVFSLVLAWVGAMLV